ncbi:MAG: hypothetical protein HY248_06735 [Fimbriimonas ginsengisoli]|nr:hypothetical protein [Fimbriimonas ginsengisoli]
MGDAWTFRSVFGGDPDIRIVAPTMRSDDDFEAFAKPVSESTALDAPVVEGVSFEVRDVPAVEASGFTHFLDGAQRAWPVMYHGLNPVRIAHTSAAMLRRTDREVEAPTERTWEGGLAVYAVPEIAARVPSDVGPVPIKLDEDDNTPIKVGDKIRKAIEQRREGIEVALAAGFDNDGWLLIDGGIGRPLDRNPGLRQVAGVVKTHARQYFKSAERVAKILSMREGQRTSVFLREADPAQGHEVYSFYLKLHDSESQGPLFGVIRVEIPPLPESLARADEIAGWLLVERAPLSLPDRRYDRLLYPIHLVEMHLKARQPTDAAILGRIG